MNPSFNQAALDLWVSVYREKLTETKSHELAAKSADAAVNALAKFASTLN